MIGGAAKASYVTVAILDALAVIVLYGSFLLKIPVRSVPHFSDLYPFAALVLFAISLIFVVMLSVTRIKNIVIDSKYMRVWVVVMLIYVVIAGMAFGGLLLGV